jgi:hypothetical protein
MTKNASAEGRIPNGTNAPIQGGAAVSGDLCPLSQAGSACGGYPRALHRIRQAQGPHGVPAHTSVGTYIDPWQTRRQRTAPTMAIAGLTVALELGEALEAKEQKRTAADLKARSAAGFQNSCGTVS